MINSFANYIKEGVVRKRIEDNETASSLFRHAEERLEYAKQKEVTEKTASFVLEDAYGSALEAVQALMAKKGYKTNPKPGSHESCLAFLKDLYSSSFSDEVIYMFDRYRQLRHDSFYRAVPVMIEDAKLSLLFAENIIKQCKSIS
jgi:uncharacterized protein (UPF0332 family)